MHRRTKFTRFHNRRSSNERSRDQESLGCDAVQRGPSSSQSSDRINDDFDDRPSTSSTQQWDRRRGGHDRRRGDHDRRRGGHDRRRGGHDRRRGGHPPELKGREIGMYYAGLQKKRSESEGVKGPTHRLQIQMDPQKEMEIQKLLDIVWTVDPRSGSGFQVKQKLPSHHQSQKVLENADEYVNAFCDSKMEGSSLDNMPASTSHIKSDTGSAIALHHRTQIKLENADEHISAFHDSNMEESSLENMTAPTSRIKSEPGCAVDDWTTVEKKQRTKAAISESPEDECHKSPRRSCHDQYQNIKDSMFKRNFLQSITESIEDKLDRVLRSHSTLEQNPELNQKLYDTLLSKRDSQRYRHMLAFRAKLPAYKMKEEILDLVRKNQVIVVSGETGCGKTTQVAQFILDDFILQKKGSTCHVICTQPRRISATSVAQRVADERNESLGEASVGYQIRLEKSLPAKQGSILFCTTGVLLQRMQSDPALCEVSHVVLDEVHERDTVCDFVITLLRDVILKRPDLKLILMSATLNADHFSKYFDNCPCINIPGFTYPVEELYLEDVLEMTHFQFPPSRATNVKNHKWKKHTGDGKGTVHKHQAFLEFIEPYVRNMDRQKYSPDTIQALLNSESEEMNCNLIAELIVCICTNKPEGAILVFLPGWTDISTLNKTLMAHKYFNSSSYLIIPLHSMMPTTVQRSVFDRPPPGVRKIILATNIAETSITIDDIVYVVDSGKIKMKQYDVESNIQTLLPEWVSLANARQRRGRAGRVQPGICYHLYTRAREMTFASYPLPEMLRSRLEEVILTAKIQQVGLVKPFLRRVMNPPDTRAVDVSIKLLFTMNALDKNENLTPLGYHLAKLPLDPQTGKMILLGALFSCVDPIFSIAASLSFKDAFRTPMGKEKLVDERKLELSNGSKSDHLLVSDVFRMWEEAEARGRGEAFCWENFLARNTLNLLKDMKGQFARYLHDMKFLSSVNLNAYESNINSNNRSLVKAIICAGLYPNVAFVHNVKVMKHGVRHRISTMEEKRVAIHPRSINAQATEFESPFIVYHLKLKSSQIYLHDSTVVYPMPLLFFGENLKYFVDKGVDMVSVNDYMKFRCKEETAGLIMELRHDMSAILEDKVCHPATINWSERNSREVAILRAIVELIAYEDRKIMDGFDYSDFDSDD